MKIAIIIGVVWILGVVFYLSLFKAASKGDRMLEENIMNDEENEDNIV